VFVDYLEIYDMSKILIGCEESQVITTEFRKHGYEAYSCDLLSCSGGHPEWHIQGDVLAVAKNDKWDLGIFHPPCDYLTCTANSWFKEQPQRKSGVLVGAARYAARELAVQFFMDIITLDIPMKAVENPIGVMSTRYRKPDQIIQPYQFGHMDRKATCLWLSGLPRLKETNNVKSELYKLPQAKQQQNKNMKRTPDRKRLRSVTYQGIAEAIVQQWGKLL